MADRLTPITREDYEILRNRLISLAEEQADERVPPNKPRARRSEENKAEWNAVFASSMERLVQPVIAGLRAERILTSAQAAIELNIPRGTLRRLLVELSDQLSQPQYRRDGRHPRRVRWLSKDDLAILRAKLLSPVK